MIQSLDFQSHQNQIDFSSLDYEQKRCLRAILRNIHEKIHHETTTTNEKKFSIFLLPESSEQNKQINALYRRLEEMPHPLSLKKNNDALLCKRIDSLFSKIQNLSQVIIEWKKQLKKIKEVCKTTLPHSQPYIVSLNNILQNYKKSEIKNLTFEKDPLICEIDKRLKLCVKKEISDQACQMVTLSHDIEGNYLKHNIQNFMQRTLLLNDKKTKLLKEINSLGDAIRKFKDKFNFLYFLLENNIPYNQTNKMMFNLKTFNFIDDSAQPLPKNEPQNSYCLDAIQEDAAIEQIVHLLVKKMGIQKVQQEICLDTNPLGDFGELIQNWTPCQRKNKAECDKALLNEGEALITEIQKLIDKFQSWEKIENIFKSIYKYKKLDFQPFAQKYKKSMDALNLRISQDSKHKISIDSLHLIVSSHDITIEELMQGLHDYHHSTALCEELVASITLKLNALHQSISTYKNAYNKHMFLNQERLENNFQSTLYFDFWHNLGYYQYSSIEPKKLEENLSTPSYSSLEFRDV